MQDIRCIAHPAHKQLVKQSVYLKYAADMNILLSYFKCEDDWHDEHKVLKALYGKMLLFKARKVSRKYQEKAGIIKSSLIKLSEAEKNGCADIDYVAGCFGDICAAVFVYCSDEWAEDLRRMGYFLGKFIYLMVA